MLSALVNFVQKRDHSVQCLHRNILYAHLPLQLKAVAGWSTLPTFSSQNFLDSDAWQRRRNHANTITFRSACRAQTVNANSMKGLQKEHHPSYLNQIQQMAAITCVAHALAAPIYGEDQAFGASIRRRFAGASGFLRSKFSPSFHHSNPLSHCGPSLPKVSCEKMTQKLQKKKPPSLGSVSLAGAISSSFLCVPFASSACSSCQKKSRNWHFTEVKSRYLKSTNDLMKNQK